MRAFSSWCAARFTPELGIGVIVILLFAAAWRGPPLQLCPNGPRTLHEVVEIARQLGLYSTGDLEGGKINHRLLVTEYPLGQARFRDFRLRDLSDPCWIGVVDVRLKWREMMPNYSPGRTVVWGELFVIGDPELIRRLTGLDPAQPDWRLMSAGAP